MIYYTTIALLLLAGCAEPDTYDPKGWPRALVYETSDGPEDSYRVEQVRLAVGLINKRVGAAVYQLAVTNDAAAAGCDTAIVEWVDIITDNVGTPVPSWRGMHSLYLKPCHSYIQLALDMEKPEEDRRPAEASTLVHELMHNLLGHDHDPSTAEHSVFAAGGGCLPADPEEGYEPPEYCERWRPAVITQSLVDRIRAKMGLPPDP